MPSKACYSVLVLVLVLVVEDPRDAGNGGVDTFAVCSGHGCAQICVPVAVVIA